MTNSRCVGWAMAIILLSAIAMSLSAAPPLTQITDTVLRADGSTFNGVVEISWPRFLAPDGSVVSPGSRRVNVRYGFLQVKLVPYASYAVRYLNGDQVTGTEIWNVPASVTPVKVVHLSPSGGEPGGGGGGGQPATTYGFADQEIPAGAVDGVNRQFALLRAPSPTASLMFYRNGVLQKRGLDYTITASSITFVPEATPQPEDILLAWYRY